VNKTIQLIILQKFYDSEGKKYNLKTTNEILTTNIQQQVKSTIISIALSK